MNSSSRRPFLSWRIRVLIVGVLGLAAIDGARAVVMVKSADGKAVKKVEVPATKPVALPDRKEVLHVDWVDTKNARLAVGGLTYPVRGALPNITLLDGTQVKDIGYLKKGTRVRVAVGTDANGVNRLTEVRVVSPPDAATATATGGPTVVAPTTSSATTTPSVTPGTPTIAPPATAPRGGTAAQRAQ